MEKSFSFCEDVGGAHQTLPQVIAFSRQIVYGRGNCWAFNTLTFCSLCNQNLCVISQSPGTEANLVSRKYQMTPDPKKASLKTTPPLVTGCLTQLRFSKTTSHLHLTLLKLRSTGLLARQHRCTSWGHVDTLGMRRRHSAFSLPSLESCEHDHRVVQTDGSRFPPRFINKALNTNRTRWMLAEPQLRLRIYPDLKFSCGWFER